MNNLAGCSVFGVLSLAIMVYRIYGGCTKSTINAVVSGGVYYVLIKKARKRKRGRRNKKKKCLFKQYERWVVSTICRPHRCVSVRDWFPI